MQRLLATFTEILHTRIEILSTELEEEGERVRQLFMYGLVSLFFLGLGLLLDAGDGGTDVGFGVSQILPALVLCYYVPEGSTILLEQPEIHLHPDAQLGMGDFLSLAEKAKEAISENEAKAIQRNWRRGPSFARRKAVAIASRRSSAVPTRESLRRTIRVAWMFSPMTTKSSGAVIVRCSRSCGVVPARAFYA